MNIGVYGGSFDPPHNGHVDIVKYVLDKMKLDKLLVIPVGIASHRDPHMVLPMMRYEMCKLAFANIPGAEVSDIEVKSGELCYTYDTLLQLKKIYGQDQQYFEIMGEDSLEYFDVWKNSEEILEMCKLVVMRREGCHSDLKHKNIIMIDSPYYPYSSTQIRENIKNGVSIDDMVSPLVKEYIIKNGLYKK